MNNRLIIWSFNQNLHQPALEHSTRLESTLADLQPITDLTEWAAYTNRVGTSVSQDLRSPGTATPITQGSLKKKRSDQKLVPVPPEFRRPKENDDTRINPNALQKRKRNRQLVSVPLELRRPNEDDSTRITLKALQQRKQSKPLVSVPPKLRLPNEDDNTQITSNALTLRKRNKQRVPVPLEFRHHNEDDNSRIKINTLELRIQRRKNQPVPVPPELRLRNEDDNTRIRQDALAQRKRKKLQSAVPPGEARHPLHQAGETSAANTLADSQSASRNNQITTSPQASSNEALMHETTQQDRIDAFKFPDPLNSDTAFSHWMDDLKTQQSAIDLFIYQDLDDPGTGGPL